MTPGDVMDEILGRFGGPRLAHEDELIAISVFAKLATEMKPDRAYLPLSPDEVQRARLILSKISSAFETAHAKKPGHFRPVEQGGR